MSWTDLSTVRKHLQEAGVALSAIENEEQVLVGTSEVQLNSRALDTSSEEVKTIDLGSPYADGAETLTGTNWTSLTHQNLVPNSLVVAGDEGLNTVYIEGTDYIVSYEQGKIRRVDGSSIPSGGTVYVWYFYFTVHVKDTDYEIDYSNGLLNRIDGGAIADSSTVYVDYSTSAGTVTDDLITQAITEAEDKILARLKDEYSTTSTDQGLKTGATELTLAVVCNGKAMDIMLKVPSDQADGASRSWREMSQRFERQAWRTLDRFLKPRAWRGPAASTNSSWTFFETNKYTDVS